MVATIRRGKGRKATNGYPMRDSGVKKGKWIIFVLMNMETIIQSLRGGKSKATIGDPAMQRFNQEAYLSSTGNEKEYEGLSIAEVKRRRTEELGLITNKEGLANMDHDITVDDSLAGSRNQTRLIQ